MKKALPLLLAVTMPLSALAFDYSAQTPYPDVRESSREAAAIYMLTNENILGGYPSGFFGVSRKINRAEFLKIALRSAGDMDGAVDRDCFVDVRASDWFSEFVCVAAERGIVSGYPEPGVASQNLRFRPEREVSYGEALKMLTMIYGYEVGAESGRDWAETYYDAAAARNVDLPITIRLDRSLTRGQAARLVAAFLAESQGKLDEYRLAEAGHRTVPSSSSPSSSLSSSSSTSSTFSSSQSFHSSSSFPSFHSSVSSTSSFTLPSTSHFLQAGAVSDAIADGVIRHPGESAHIRAVEIKLYQEVTALNSLKVFTDKGVEVATLMRRTNTDTADYKLTFQAQLNPGVNDFAIPGDTDVRLVVRADVRSIANNGASDQALQMRTFNVTVQGDSTNQSVNYAPAGPFPMHQTAFGRIVSATPTGPVNGTLASGTSALVAAYTFNGSAVEGKRVRIEHLTFAVAKSDAVQASLWKLRGPGGQNVDCSMGSDGVSCMNIPASMGVIQGQDGVKLELYANVSVPSNAAGAFLQADLMNTGAPNALGSIHWTDESGRFRWTEAGTVKGKGTRWQK